MTNTRYRVLLVDGGFPEHFTMRLLLARELDVFAARGLDEAWSLLMSTEVDVLVMDPTLDGTRGTELFEIVRMMLPEVARVALLTGPPERFEEWAQRGLADAVVDRGAAPKVVLDCVRAFCPLPPLVPELEPKKLTLRARG